MSFIKNIKHASSDNIEIINEVKDINFDENKEYYVIAKKDNLYVLLNKEKLSLIVDVGIFEILKEKNLIGGL